MSLGGSINNETTCTMIALALITRIIGLVCLCAQQKITLVQSSEKRFLCATGNWFELQPQEYCNQDRKLHLTVITPLIMVICRLLILRYGVNFNECWCLKGNKHIIIDSICSMQNSMKMGKLTEATTWWNYSQTPNTWINYIKVCPWAQPVSVCGGGLTATLVILWVY